MRSQAIGRGPLRAAAAIGAAVAMAACGASPITPTRIERAIAPTFANLVHAQVSSLGLPPTAAADFEVTANCRTAATGVNIGSGDWVCTLRWHGPDRRLLRDVFDVSVTTDGCYAATAEGESLGAPTLRSPDGRQVRNMLHAFEGCFDTT